MHKSGNKISKSFIQHIRKNIFIYFHCRSFNGRLIDLIISYQVIMGGGAQHMGLPMSEPIDPDTCVRGDGQNLATVWTENNPKGKLVTDTEQLLSIDIANTSKILGIFTPSHLPYHTVKTNRTPTLAEMTQQAVRLLRKNNNGFFLMVSRSVFMNFEQNFFVSVEK